MTQSYRGVLIDFEGIDGSGKTTHVELTKNWLEKMGKTVTVLKEPTKGEYGRRISQLASEGLFSPQEELDLFIKDRKEDVANNILPALNNGNIVIMDRYYYSNIAYQAARGLDPEEIKDMNEKFSPKPDLIIVLDINPKNGMERVYERKNTVKHFENVDYLEKVREQFLLIGKQQNSVIIPSNRPISEVQNDIQKVIENILLSIT